MDGLWHIATGLGKGGTTELDLLAGHFPIRSHGRGPEEAHEVGKAVYVVGHGLRLGEVVVDAVLRRIHHPATRRRIGPPTLAPFIGEQFVRDALLHVVRLAGKDHERLVLRFPAEPGDRSIVAVAIGSAEYAEGLRGRFVGQDGSVLDGLYQTVAKERRRDAESQLLQVARQTGHWR